MGSICVALDGSLGSVAALRWGVHESHLRNCQLAVVMAWQYPAGHGGIIETALVSLETVANNASTLLEETIEKVMVLDSIEGDQIVRTLRLGATNNVLVSESSHHDLMIVGSRGHTGLAELLLGSSAAHLLKHSTCPVVVVRDSSSR
jgi:nucleotide-binding universal stress UspA family protein